MGLFRKEDPPMYCDKCSIKMEYHNIEYKDHRTGEVVPANTWVFIEDFGNVEHDEVVSWYRKELL